MEAIERCNCGCGLPRPLQGRRGPRAIYATPACRKRAFDRKRYLSAIGAIDYSWFSVDMPDRKYASPLERLSQAVVEARVLCNVLDQLGTEADPRLAWRAFELSNTLRQKLVVLFPNP